MKYLRRKKSTAVGICAENRKSRAGVQTRRGPKKKSVPTNAVVYRYLVCKNLKNPDFFCKGKAELDNDGNFTSTAAHAERCKDAFATDKALFREELYLKVKESPANPKDTYDAVASLNPIGAQFVPYALVSSRMREWRNESQPPSPNDINDLADVLNSESWRKALTYETSYADENTETVEKSAHEIKAYGVTSDGGTSHVVLGTKSYCARFSEARTAFVDATYAVTPNLDGAYQFLTLMLEIQGEVLPVCWAIMSRKTAEAYGSVIDTMAEQLLPHLHLLESVMTDFEPALQNAMQRAFPEAELFGCYFHHCHAILKERQKSSVITRVKKHHPEMLNQAYSYERNLMNLAFLPPEYIEEAFNDLLDSLQENEELFAIMGPLFLYYKSFWIDRTGPKIYSVYRRQERTNNRVERYHRSLKMKMSSNSEIHKFMTSLISIQTRAHQDLHILEHGLQLRSPQEKKYRQRDANIKKAWQELGELEIVPQPVRKSKIIKFLKTLETDTALSIASFPLTH